MKLKAVMDTNVLISGVLWRGIPFELLRWAEKDRLVIYTSLEILAMDPIADFIQREKIKRIFRATRKLTLPNSGNTRNG